MSEENLLSVSAQTDEQVKVEGTTEQLPAHMFESGDYWDIRRHDASTATQLAGLHAIRKRPGMYIGAPDMRGLHELAFYLLQHSVDEHVEGFGSRIQVTLHADNSLSIRDEGRGISLEPDPRFPNFPELPHIQLRFTCLQVLGLGERASKYTSGIPIAMGHKIASALAQLLTVEVTCEGKVYFIEFSRGLMTKALHVIGDSTGSRSSTGTMIRYYPDTDIFDCPINFKFDLLAKQMRELAFLYAGLELVLKDEREPRREGRYHYKGGVAEYVHELSGLAELAGIRRLHPYPIVINKPGTEKREPGKFYIECALQFTDGVGDHTMSYTNAYANSEGGTHVTGFRMALKRAIKQYANINQLMQEGDPELVGVDTREGIICILTIWRPHAMFWNQLRSKLISREVQPVVSATVYAGLRQFLEDNPEAAMEIVENTRKAALARIASPDGRSAIDRSRLAMIPRVQAMHRLMKDSVEETPDTDALPDE